MYNPFIYKPLTRIKILRNFERETFTKVKTVYTHRIRLTFVFHFFFLYMFFLTKKVGIHRVILSLVSHHWNFLPKNGPKRLLKEDSLAKRRLDLITFLCQTRSRSLLGRFFSCLRDKSILLQLFYYGWDKETSENTVKSSFTVYG